MVDSHPDVVKVLHGDWNVLEAVGVKQGFARMYMMSNQASRFDLPKVTAHSARAQLKVASFRSEMPIARKSIGINIFDLENHVGQIIIEVWS